ncbi:hypothetical protein GYB22_04630 [bacterium]|nr:hypothetical protein [bacterium]
MKIYLDIDGVLLSKNNSVPKDLDVFIEYIVQNCECYWLTTHCRNGENKALLYLSQYLPNQLLTMLEQVKPAYWSDKKTEAIDFNSEFIWLDDYPFEAEIEDLKKRDKLESLIKVDLNSKDELKGVLKLIEHKI